MALYEDYHKPDEALVAKAVANFRGVDEGIVKVVSFDFERDGTLPGENFTSIMKLISVRSEVDGEQVEDNFMSKLHSKGSPLTQVWDEMGMFPREAQFYGTLLPALSKLQKPEAAPLPFPRAAFADPAVPIIVMENLKEAGFAMVDPKPGWTADRLRLTFLELARYHACTYHFMETFPGGADALRDGRVLAKPYKSHLDHIYDFGKKPLWGLETEDLNEQSRSRTMSVINAGADLALGALDKDIADRYKAFDLESAAGASQHPNESGFNVIIRGDTWSNNFMFKDKDDGTPSEVRFVDIQVCKRCRPTLDLAVLAMTSTTPELREQHLDGLLAEYHAALVGHLDAFGHDGAKLYPLEQLREDYKHSMGYALFFGFLNVQTVLNTEMLSMCNKDDLDQIESAMVDGDRKKRLSGNNVLVGRLAGLVKEGAKWGLY